MIDRKPLKVQIKVEFQLSFWDAIKMRIAGKKFMQQLMDHIKSKSEGATNA